MKRHNHLFMGMEALIFLVAVAGIVLIVTPMMPSAPVALNTITGQVYSVGDTIPAEYAPPWDVFDPGAGLFFTVADPDYTGLGPGDTVDVQLTINRPGGFIYNYLLYSEGDDWENDTLGNGYWLTGEVTKTLTYRYDDLDEENYLLIYTCKYNEQALNDSWDCGCKEPLDPACRSYQIQWFPGPEALPPGTTGCTTDDNCTDPYLPHCNVDTGECVECLSHPHCRDTAAPFYDPDQQYCWWLNKVCVECNNDGHCPADRPHCNQELRICEARAGCTSDADCTDPAEPRCDLSMGVCVECLTDDDCATNEICFEGECIEEDPSSSGSLCIVDREIVYEFNDVGPCDRYKPNAPYMYSLLFNPGTDTLYSLDYLGMSSFKLNGLNPAQSKVHNYLLGQSGTFGTPHPCAWYPGMGSAPNCLATSGDCYGYRTRWWSSFAGEDEVYAHTAFGYTFPATKLLFNGAGSAFSLVASFGNYYDTDTSTEYNQVVTRNGGGHHVIGTGSTSIPAGRYVMFWKTSDGKRLWLLRPATSGEPSDFHLIDATNVQSPQDLGLISSTLAAALEPYKNYLGSYNTRMTSPTKLALADLGSQFKLYDITDPRSAQLIDTFPDNKNDQQFSISASYGPKWRDGNTYYIFHDNDGLYQHVKNSGTGWTKAVDTPRTMLKDIQVYDGKLFIHSSSYGDPYKFKIIDIASGELLMDEPEPIAYYESLNAGSVFAGFKHQELMVTKKNGKYYLYKAFSGQRPSYAGGNTIILGFEVSDNPDDCGGPPACTPDCTGAACGDDDGCGRECHGTCPDPGELCVGSGGGYRCDVDCHPTHTDFVCSAGEVGDVCCEKMGSVCVTVGRRMECADRMPPGSMHTCYLWDSGGAGSTCAIPGPHPVCPWSEDRWDCGAI